MPKQEAKTCWDYWECKPEVREKCPAFKSSKPCWYIAINYCGRVSGKYGVEKCFTCEWYRLKHPSQKRKSGNYDL
ncbi:MAG: hypothetical protein Q8R31_04510 [Candidatus Omnitrophota bacterium]|nr:hypothetical protein [Candidatus Omnitrophota bacterium]